MKAKLNLDLSIFIPSIIKAILPSRPRRNRRLRRRSLRPRRRSLSGGGGGWLGGDSLIKGCVTYLRAEAAKPQMSETAAVLNACADYFDTYLDRFTRPSFDATLARGPVDVAPDLRGLLRPGEPFPTPKGEMSWTEDKPGFWVLRQGAEQLGATARIQPGLWAWSAGEAHGEALGPDALFEARGAVMAAVMGLTDEPCPDVDEPIPYTLNILNTEKKKRFVGHATDAERVVDNFATALAGARLAGLVEMEQSARDFIERGLCTVTQLGEASTLLRNIAFDVNRPECEGCEHPDCEGGKDDGIGAGKPLTYETDPGLAGKPEGGWGHKKGMPTRIAGVDGEVSMLLADLTEAQAFDQVALGTALTQMVDRGRCNRGDLATAGLLFAHAAHIARGGPRPVPDAPVDGAQDAPAPLVGPPPTPAGFNWRTRALSFADAKHMELWKDLEEVGSIWIDTVTPGRPLMWRWCFGDDCGSFMGPKGKRLAIRMVNIKACPGWYDRSGGALEAAQIWASTDRLHAQGIVGAPEPRDGRGRPLSKLTK